MRNKWVEEAVARARENILATPPQSPVQLFGRVAMVTKKVRVGKEGEDATFYFTDDPQRKRYHLADLQALAQEVFDSLGESRDRWYVSIPGTFRGKWRNKREYERSRLLGEVAERVSKISQQKTRVNKVKVYTPGKGVLEVEIKEGIQRMTPERVRKLLR